MIVRFNKGGGLKGEIKAVPSKSVLHRHLIAAALSTKPTALAYIILSDDIKASISLVEALGAKVDITGDSITVYPGSALETETSEAFINESGTTLRLGIPVLMHREGTKLLEGAGRLMQRPLEEYEDIFEHSQSHMVLDGNTLRLTGRIKPGNYVVRADRSSQFASGLLMLLPILESDSTLKLIGKVESRSYIDITLDVIAEYGIEISEEEGTFFVKGNQEYITKGKYEIEGDYSQAAFMLCAGAISGDVTVKGLSSSSKQGDRKIVDILRSMGADITAEKGSVRARKSSLTSTTIDASDIPDLVPILSIAATAAAGETRFKNVDRLRYKESDRLSAITDLFSGFNPGIHMDGEILVVPGRANPLSGTFSSRSDHRIAMSLSVAALLCEGDIIVEGFEAISKSYPHFLKDYISLGGICHEL